MMKKALLGLVCVAVLVMVPACHKKERRVVETRTETRQPARQDKNKKTVKKTTVKKETVKKETPNKKTMKKTTVKKERVGNKLRAEELNEEDKD